jgi:hypothetical protein
MRGRLMTSDELDAHERRWKYILATPRSTTDPM